MKISLIAAMGRNSVIGKDGKIPWHLSADLKYFKKMTMGKPVIMGRKTFDSIGKPLPGRDIIAVTRDAEVYRPEGIRVAGSIDAALATASNDEVDEVMVAGGAQIYEQTIARADHLFITRINANFEGDTYFPDFDPLEWTGAAAISHKADDKNPHDYDFLRFDRMI